MSRDQVVGVLLVIAVAVIVAYGWMVFFTEWSLLLLQVTTGFVAVAGVFGILAWIGYTLATTPPPKPIEEIEKELEEELENLESKSAEEAKETGS